MTNHPSHQSTPDALTLDDVSNEALLKDPSVHQLPLPLVVMTDGMEGSYLENLASLLTGDLDFHGNDAGYASHNYHPFPAKFPPPLPRTFIRGLTRPGDVVMDPMMGSGTTVVEAYLLDRQAKGYDIDPLIDKNSQIQQRMHEEFVVGFYKPIDLQTLRFPISFKTLARHWRSTMRSYAVA